MYSQGLKINIGTLLALLIAVGMIMVNLVTTILWQQNVVESETIRGQDITNVTINYLHKHRLEEKTEYQIEEELTNLLAGTGALCTSVLLPGKTSIIAGSWECYEDEMAALLVAAKTSRGWEKLSFGAGWGVFQPANQYLAVAAPLTSADRESRGSVGVIMPLAPIYLTIRQDQRYVFTYIGINVLVLTLIGLVRFVKLTVRPVEKLLTLTDSYTESDDIPMFVSEERNEFGQLSIALNKMLWRIEENRKELRETVKSLQEANRQLLETQREMIQAEKMASIGRLAAGLAHEIGNPIAIVQGYLGLLEDPDLRDGEKIDFVCRAEKELQRISSLIRQLLDFSRSPTCSLHKVTIHALLIEVTEAVSIQPMVFGVKIQSSLLAKKDVVWADPDQLRQVFLNCLINAADAIAAVQAQRPGEISIATRLETQKQGVDGREIIVICVRDNGIGIPQEESTNIFDPFFTTKEPGKGTGLGLSVSHSIITGYGGSIRADNRLEGGAEIIIELPLVD